LRHGRSRANEQGVIASSLANAGDDFGLTPEGRAQVRTTIEAARGRLTGPVHVVASPLLRARETAEIVAQGIGVVPEVDDRLIERGFGELELARDNRYESVWEIDRRDPSHRTWNVESVADVWSRVCRLMDDRWAGVSSGTLMLVTHGDVASTLICGSAGVPLSRHREVGGLATGEMQELEWPRDADPPMFVDDS